MGKTQSAPQSAFTLIELLVVITIIGILAAIVLIAINPAEMARKGRDATRLSDLENIRKAIDIEVAQGTAVPNTGGIVRRSNNGTRNCDGSGWMDGNIDLCDYLATLPVDPSGAAVAYEFNADGTSYEIRTQLESSDNDDKEQNDGGDDNTWYECGTDLTLL